MSVFSIRAIRMLITVALVTLVLVVPMVAAVGTLRRTLLLAAVLRRAVRSRTPSLRAIFLFTVVWIV